ncbi:hypothetical protein D3C85_1301440 [compost metagenome]
MSIINYVVLHLIAKMYSKCIRQLIKMRQLYIGAIVSKHHQYPALFYPGSNGLDVLGFYIIWFWVFFWPVRIDN